MDTKIVRGEHQSMAVFPREGISKPRRIFQVCGMGNGTTFGVHNNSLTNLRRGLVERVFYVEDACKNLVPTPQPLPGKFQELKYLARRVARIAGHHTPIPREQYPGLYKGRRYQIYADAVNSLASNPVHRRDSFLKTFVKAEKINFSAKPDPAPRVIQPRDPRYNVEVGRYLKPYEHHLYRALDVVWKGPTVLKGYTVSEIGSIMHSHWSQFQKPCAVGFDMKRFDQHVSVDALRFEHSVYGRSFCSKELDRLLEWQLLNSGVGHANDGYIRYKVDGCRMSGDVNTAMGNCLLACLITKHLLKGIRCRLINNGDDCVLFFNTPDLAAVTERLAHWLDFGFQCVVEKPVYELEEVEFCQMKPVFDGEEWVCVRNVHVSVAKDTYSINPWNNENDAGRWIRAIGECGEALTGGIPVLNAYYKVFKRAYRAPGKVKESLAFDSGMYRLSQRCSRSFHEPTEEARVSFFKAFGVDPMAQMAIEEFYDSLDIELEFAPEGKLDDISLLWLLRNRMIAS